MKLYYSPFACSFAAHIACREAGLPVDLVRVELSSKRTQLGTDLFSENPMGQVPTLVLDDGRILTENVAVLAFLGDLGPKIATPSNPTADGYELTRWLSFVATEVHKKILAPIFNPSPDAVKDFARTSAPRALRFLETHLAARDTLLGGGFTVADAYLYWALTILPNGGVPLDDYPVLRAYLERHRQRPAVRAAYRYEKEQWQTPFAA